ncbi:MAG: hypothetical protein KKH12_03020 [Gammaproteobacteria bacterium]|nr:hypothetical protein [Gammaproteobacteria bacterium]MBU1480626.1 hypothetical protein [Gammaproteobacteria bacterium]
MDATTWGFVGALAGTVIGAAASIFTTLITNWNASRLQQNADSLERAERARSFQRDNLLELQVSIQDAMRLVGRAHHEDVVASKKSGGWGESKLSEEVNQNIHLTNTKLSVLSVRVADDDLRSKLELLRRKITKCLFAKSEIEGEALILDALSEFNTFMEQLGKVLRSNY